MEQLNRVTKNPLRAEGITKPAITWLWKDQDCARRYTDAVSLTRQAASLGRQKFERKLERGSGLCVTLAHTVPPHCARHTQARSLLLNIKTRKNIRELHKSYAKLVQGHLLACLHLGGSFTLVAETSHTSRIYGLSYSGPDAARPVNVWPRRLAHLFVLFYATYQGRSKAIDNGFWEEQSQINRTSRRHM